MFPQIDEKSPELRSFELFFHFSFLSIIIIVIAIIHLFIKKNETATMMTLSETALFQKKFALHLAVGLLGPTKVLEYLRNESIDRSSSSSLLSRPQQPQPQQQQQRVTVPLYWRSKIILTDTSIILQNNCGEGEKNTSSTEITASKSKLLFFDVTIDFVRKEQQQQQGENNNNNKNDDDDDGSCQILVSLGFFLLLRKGTADDDDDEIVGHYVSTKALNHQQLMSHITSLRLEPQSVKAEALANLMFESFLSQEPPITAVAEEDDDNSNSCVNARYVVLSSNSTSSAEKKNEGNGEEEEYAPLLRDIDGSSDDNICDLCVDVPCKSMGNSKGTFLLKISTVSKFDKSALRFLYWDLTKNANHYHHRQQEQEQEHDVNEVLAQVEDAFRELEKKMRPNKVTNNTNSTNNTISISDNRNGESIASTTNVTITTITTRSNKSKIKQNPRFMPNKRRKKKAGNFYAPSVEES